MIINNVADTIFMSSTGVSDVIRLPGMVDMHVHLREPGFSYKEDWATGTSAAIAGGVVAVVDMPNTNPPTITLERLEEKKKIAKEKALCDYGFYFGSDGNNVAEFNKVYDRVLGLKLYLGETTGASSQRHSRFSGSPIPVGDDKMEESVSLLMEDEKKVADIFKAWPRGKPILVHAEGERLELAISLAEKNYQKLHCCHVASKEDIEHAAKAKARGVQITCEVSPHHLFLTQKDVERLRPFGMMKPELGTAEDQRALWEHIQKGTVDCVATDHAPHTKQEKLGIDLREPAPPRSASSADASRTSPSEGGESINQVPSREGQGWVFKGPWGVPGLETALPLLVTAMEEGRLTREQIISLTSVNPWRILGSRPPVQTSVEMEVGISYKVNEAELKTKCGWSPFIGITLTARVVRTVIHGQEAYNNGKILSKGGSGKNII